MDLSTRVQYLNSLLEQGAITEDEYAIRSEPLQVASEIIQASTSGDVAALERIFRENPDMNADSICQNETTPLSIAIGGVVKGRGNSKLLQILLSHGAQPNRRKAGVSPLLTLCQSANFPDAVNCARVLLQAGADAKATIIVSGKSEPVSCISLAVDSDASADLIRLLCEHGASPNDQLSPHGPLLIHCIIEEIFPTALVLLESGADPNARQASSGASCLAVAISTKRTQIVEELLRRGADRDMPVMRDQKTTARQLVAQLAGKDPVGFQAIERLF